MNTTKITNRDLSKLESQSRLEAEVREEIERKGKLDENQR
jgi:hypothetical protein